MKKSLSRKEFTFIRNVFLNNKGRIVVSVLVSIFLTLAGLVTPYLLKLQIDQLEEAHTDLFQVFYASPLVVFIAIIALTILAAALEHVFSYWSDISSRKLNNDLAISFEQNLYKKYESFDVSFQSNPRTRRITDTIFRGTYIAQDILSLFTDFLRAAISLLGIIPILASVNISIFIIVLICTILQALYSRFQVTISNSFNLTNERIANKKSELRWVLLVKFHQIVITGGQEKIVKEYFDLVKQSNENILKRVKTTNRWGWIYWVVGRFPGWSATFIVGLAVLNNQLSLGDFTMITLYTTQLSGVFTSTIHTISRWFEISLDILKIGFFLNLKPRFATIDNPSTGPIKGDLVLENVNFHYPNLDIDEKNYLQYMLDHNERIKKYMNRWHGENQEMNIWQEILSGANLELPQVLNNVNLHCKQGEITALVGPNGSGKTTITNFLIRNYDPNFGKVSIGGTELQNFLPVHVRKYVSLLSQEPLVLENFSIKENLLLGVTDEVSDERIWNLLKDLDLASAVDKFPKKLDSLIGDEIRLSGGQSQLLVIARVILQNRPVLIFDEGTNQLDAEHEKLINDMLQKRKRDSTVLMITHKMTTARRADKIYVLNKGEIVESGNHQELLAKKGLYERYWNLQVID